MSIVGPSHFEIFSESITNQKEREGGQDAFDDEFGCVVDFEIAEVFSRLILHLILISTYYILQRITLFSQLSIYSED